MSDFIPQEIIVKILYNLPVKSLVKCTLVCKLWQSLITSPCFIKTHLDKTLAKPLASQPLLIRHFTDYPRKEDYSLHSNNNGSLLEPYQAFKSPLKPRKNLYPRIVGTVHGLLCVCDDLFSYSDKIVLWNPLVRKVIVLPGPIVTYAHVGPYKFVLGFGFDAKGSDYKVVRLVYPFGPTPSALRLPPEVEVFSVKERGWRMVSSGKRLDVCFDCGWTQCFLNGRVHWTTYESTIDAVRNWVLLFDMEDEKFRKMRLPEPLVDVTPNQLSISVSRGMLTVSKYYYPEATDRCCDIWVRTQYGDVKSWSKLYTVDGLGIAGSVFGLTQSGEVLLAKLEGVSYADYQESFEVRRGELVSYDPKTRQTKVVQPQGVLDAFFVADYVESLVFLDKDSGATSYGEARCKSVNPESEGTANPALDEAFSVGLGSSEDDSDEDKEVELDDLTSGRYMRIYLPNN